LVREGACSGERRKSSIGAVNKKNASRELIQQKVIDYLCRRKSEKKRNRKSRVCLCTKKKPRIPSQKKEKIRIKTGTSGEGQEKGRRSNSVGGKKTR